MVNIDCLRADLEKQTWSLHDDYQIHLGLRRQLRTIRFPETHPTLWANNDVLDGISVYSTSALFSSG